MPKAARAALGRLNARARIRRGVQNMHLSGERLVTVFLCGDVMTGRGVDQILPHPSDPPIHEAFVSDARTYVALAEEVNGPIPRRVELAYIWGDALAELQHVAPDARIVNLETSVTRSDDAWPKGINYRMHPANVGCLTAAGIDVCVLANNHVLDYGYAGLVETLETLHRDGLKTAGAGRTLGEARQPAVVDVAADCESRCPWLRNRDERHSPSWAAAEDLPGTDVLFDLSEETAAATQRVSEQSSAARTSPSPRSIGAAIGATMSARARALCTPADRRRRRHRPRPLVASSSANRGLSGRLILYGCGDFINDYEGIWGHEKYRTTLRSCTSRN